MSVSLHSSLPTSNYALLEKPPKPDPKTAQDVQTLQQHRPATTTRTLERLANTKTDVRTPQTLEHRSSPVEKAPPDAPDTPSAPRPPAWFGPVDAHFRALSNGALPAQANGQNGGSPATPDPKAEAERILDVGKKRGHDDYDARLKSYAAAIEGQPLEYREKLLAAILEKDSDALNSWLEPERINNAAESGKISHAARASIAEALTVGYNDGTIPASVVENSFDRTVRAFEVGSGLTGTYDAAANANRASELLDFLNSAPSTQATRDFRTKYAQHLADAYALNDKYNVDNGQSPPDPSVRYAAAAFSALLVSGDAAHPELTAEFLAAQDGNGRLDDYLKSVAAGSAFFSESYLAPQIEGNPNYSLADIAQPDALATLASTVARADGPVADQVAARLAHVPGDLGGLFRAGNEDRLNAWSDLFNAHSKPILDELSNPDGLPEYQGGKVEPRFKDRAHDFGAYLRLIESGRDQNRIDAARTSIVGYANQLKADIAGATTAAEAHGLSRRLGFLAAGVTESVRQGFEAHAQSQERKRALLGFVLDLALSAIPIGGDNISARVGKWLADKLGEGLLEDALEGFQGAVIDRATGALTDAAKEHILNNLGDDNIAKLIVKLEDSNAFIRDTLVAAEDLPAPGYEQTEGGKRDTIQDVTAAYDIALVWLGN